MTLETLRADSRAKALGDSTNESLNDTDCDRYLNQYYHRAIEYAMRANGDWQVNGEIAYTPTFAGQREYTVPDDLLRLGTLYFKATESGDYLPTKQIDPYNIPKDPEDYNPSTPEIDLIEDGIRVYTSEDIEDTTDGLKIHYQASITELSASDDSPTLPAFIQKYMTIGTAYEYSQDIESYKKADRLQQRLLKLEEEIKTYYSNRSTAKPLIIEVAEENNY